MSTRRRASGQSAIRRRTSTGWRTAVVLLVAAGPVQSAAAADYFAGRDVFTTHCAACHGNDGRSSLPGMPDFVAGDSLMRPDVEIYRRIRTGQGAMPAFQGVLTETQMRDVIVYLRSLQR